MNTTKKTSNSTKTASANFFNCDHIGKRIYGSAANFKKAEIFGTAQYEALMILMERHPNYSLDAIAPDIHKQSYKGLNFDLMMEYVKFMGTVIQKAEFQEIVDTNSPFPVIKSWFIDNFKVGFTVEKAMSEIAAAKRKIAQETLNATKSKVRKVVKTKLIKVDGEATEATIAQVANN